MTSHRFFISQTQIHSPWAVLEGDEHHHLSRVSRIKKGRRVWLFDETGTSYLAEVDVVEAHKTRLRILDVKPDRTPSPRIFLAMSVIKAHKMEWVLQKGIELGMYVFIPLNTTRSVVKLAAGSEKKNGALDADSPGGSQTERTLFSARSLRAIIFAGPDGGATPGPQTVSI